jgi:hypothetical protein
MIVPVTGIGLLDLAISAFIAGGLWTFGSWVIGRILPVRPAA